MTDQATERTIPVTEAGPGFAGIVGAYATRHVGNADATEFRVRVAPDGSMTVTWPAPDEYDRTARDAAILDRDHATAFNLRGLLLATKAGAIR